VSGNKTTLTWNNTYATPSTCTVKEDGNVLQTCYWDDAEEVEVCGAKTSPFSVPVNNDAAGTRNYSVYCKRGGSECTATKSLTVLSGAVTTTTTTTTSITTTTKPSTTTTTTAPPATACTVSLSAGSTSLSNGESTTLSWSSTNATGYSSKCDDWNGGSVNNSGSAGTGALSGPGSASYSMKCYAADLTPCPSNTVTINVSAGSSYYLISPSEINESSYPTDFWAVWSSGAGGSCTFYGYPIDLTNGTQFNAFGKPSGMIYNKSGLATIGIMHSYDSALSGGSYLSGQDLAIKHNIACNYVTPWSGVTRVWYNDPTTSNPSSFSGNNIILKWKDNSAKEIGYDIKRYFENAGCNGAVKSEVAVPSPSGLGVKEISDMSYTDTDPSLDSTKSYCYEVTAIRGLLDTSSNPHLVGTSHPVQVNVNGVATTTTTTSTTVSPTTSSTTTTTLHWWNNWIEVSP
jgi:hypothetical protein